MSGRIWLRCRWCNKTFNQLMKHWSQSRCGPAVDEREQARTAAREEAHALTQKAVITQETLDQLGTRPDPLQALADHLGITVVDAQHRRQRPVNYLSI